jgi:2-haloalkanoic acid dehalogenase type II
VSTPDFTPYRALSFDCYGTLIDWESGIRQAFQPWAAAHAVAATFDELLDRFGVHENVIESESPTLPYPSVLADALRRIGADLGVPVSDADATEFGASVGDWPAFADTAAALRRLHRRFRLIILSNVDRASFARTNRRLGVTFDLVLTAEDIGSYKPDQANFDRLLDDIGSIGVGRDELLHVAQSLFHDHGPARRIGLPSVWIDRYPTPPGTGASPPSDVRVDWRYGSMAEFADAALAGAVEPGPAPAVSA